LLTYFPSSSTYHPKPSPPSTARIHRADGARNEIAAIIAMSIMIPP